MLCTDPRHVSIAAKAVENHAIWRTLVKEHGDDILMGLPVMYHQSLIQLLGKVNVKSK
jgi:hypothetical protein